MKLIILVCLSFCFPLKYQVLGGVSQESWAIGELEHRVTESVSVENRNVWLSSLNLARETEIY